MSGISLGAVRHRRPRRCQLGQSLVEFTLIFPIMLLILLTVADFGRYFAAGITIESIARTAAETAAEQYRVDLLSGIDPVADPSEQARLHQVAWQSVCDESGSLPNVSLGSPGTQCPGIATMVCIHDGADPNCGAVYNDGGVSAGCNSFEAGNAPSSAKGLITERAYVEVRVCYRFSTFLPMRIPFVGGSLSPLSGDWFIGKSRMFTVADW